MTCQHMLAFAALTCRAGRPGRGRLAPSSPRWTRWWRARPSRCSSPPPARRTPGPSRFHSWSRSGRAPWTTGGMSPPLPSWDQVSHRMRPALPPVQGEWNWMQEERWLPAACSAGSTATSACSTHDPHWVGPSLALGGSYARGRRQV